MAENDISNSEEGNTDTAEDDTNTAEDIVETAEDIIEVVGDTIEFVDGIIETAEETIDTLEETIKDTFDPNNVASDFVNEQVDSLKKIFMPSYAFNLPPVKFNFVVVIFSGGIWPNLIDMRFSKVSGMNSWIETESFEQGGQNIKMHTLPKNVKYDTLKLESGIVIDSDLNEDFNVAMTELDLKPGNVLVSALDRNDNPIYSKLFLKTYPVKWEASELDANSNELMIDTIELAYQKFILIEN